MTPILVILILWNSSIWTGKRVHSLQTIAEIQLDSQDFGINPSRTKWYRDGSFSFPSSFSPSFSSDRMIADGWEKLQRSFFYRRKLQRSKEPLIQSARKRVWLDPFRSTIVIAVYLPSIARLKRAHCCFCLKWMQLEIGNTHLCAIMWSYREISTSVKMYVSYGHILAIKSCIASSVVLKQQRAFVEAPFINHSQASARTSHCPWFWYKIYLLRSSLHVIPKDRETLR